MLGIYVYIYIYIYREREREREREVFKKKKDFIIIIFFWFLTSSPTIFKLINKSLDLITIRILYLILLLLIFR